MKVTCYGSRGSLPAPSRKGFDTDEFGGNTNCFYVEMGPFKLIESCGSGVSVLSDRLMVEWLTNGRKGQDYIMPLSHYHWDHIQGLPFLVPAYIGGNRLHFHGFRPSGYEGHDQRKSDRSQPQTAVEMMLAHQQSNPHFPVAHEAMPAEKHYHAHNRQFSETFWYGYADGFLNYWEHRPQKPAPWMGNLPDEDVLKITTIPLNHPDGCLGWRVEYMGKVVAFCYDCEPFRYANAKISALAKGADLMILDGAYTEDQLRGAQQGFGHGSPESCIDQAKDADAKFCLIHHHDPKHDDRKLGDAEIEAGFYAEKVGYTGTVEFSREGRVYDLGGQP